MANNQPIQNSFAGGELSPLMDMRHDIEGRKQGVKIMENMFSHLQGPARTRGGSERILDVTGNSGRIFEFIVNTFTGYIVTITTEFIYVSDNDGFVHKDDLMPNGDFLNGGDLWTIEEIGGATVTFVGGACILAPGVGLTHSATLWGFFTGVIGQPHEVKVQIVSGFGDMRVRIGSSQGASDYHDGTYSGEGTITVSNIVPVGTPDVHVECYVAGQLPSKTLDTISAFNTALAPEPVVFPSPWATNSEIAFIQAEMPPKEFSLYFTSPNVPIQILAYDVPTRDWDFSELVIVSPPAEWVDGSYPAALTFFEGRLYVGGCNHDPEDFWGSKPWIFNDFTLAADPDNPLPDDAIHYSVSKRGLIRWLQGSSTLLIGTEYGEFIASSQGGLLIPGDIRIEQQSANGSQAMESQLAGNNVLYVSGDSRKIRSMTFEWTKEAWQSKDITFGAEHITDKGNLLTHLAYAKNPYNLIWASTANGTFIGGSYEAQAQNAGFHRHWTSGNVNSICVKEYGGTSELWLLVDRDEEGTVLTLERHNFDIKLDSFTQFHFETPSDTLTGLEYLGGKQCQIIADGAVHPELIVPFDGIVTLNAEYTDVYIGLQVSSRLLTSARDDGMGIEEGRAGSARPALKRWSRVYVKIYDSFKPVINGHMEPNRTAATPMGAIEPPKTEDVNVSLRGWDREALIDIVQNEPLPTTVLGIFGEMAQEVV